MPYEVMMPRLGWSMERGVLGQWLKRDGDPVLAGEVLFTVESDKATQEVEALDSGILHIPADSPPAGTEVAVGTLLAYLMQPGESAPFQTESGAVPDTGVPKTASAGDAGPVAPPHAQHSDAESRLVKKPASSPRARRIAAKLGVNWRALQGTGRSGRIIERDVQTAARTTPARVSPLARAVAAEQGIDLDMLADTAPGRRIERADVEAAVREKATARGAELADPAQLIPGRRQPLTPIRQMIANRMSTSAHTTAPVTLTTEVDASELVLLREQLRSVGETPLPSYNDFLVKLVAQVLIAHPALNARLDGDAISQADVINMGIAVDTERGLLVPVIRNVQHKSVREIARESAELIARARQGQAKLDELQGGTFTLSNLGMYEIDAFTPIINLPECAILGIGRIVPKQTVIDAGAGQMAIRHMMFLSLTFDHRVVDGAPAARFLQQVKGAIEHPAAWFVGLH